MAIRCYLLAIFLVGAFGIIAQQLPVNQQFLLDYTVDVWTDKDGMPSKSIKRVSQSADGYLWVSGYNGLCRFDGQLFEVLDLEAEVGAGSNVMGDVLAQGEYVYLGTNEGSLIRYHKKTGFQKLFELPDHARKAIESIWVDEETQEIWVGVRGSGVFHFRNDSLKQFRVSPLLLNVTVNDIFRDSKNRLWIATEGNGLICVAGVRITQYTENEGLPSNLALAVCEDPHGRIWIGSSNGLSYLKDNKITQIALTIGKTIGRMIADDEDLWFVSYNHGIFRWQYNSEHLDALSEANGLPSNAIIDIVEDNDKNIWFASYRTGLGRVKRNLFFTYTDKNGLGSNAISAVFQAKDGVVYTSTDKDLFRMDKGVFVKEPIDGGRIKHINQTRDGRMLISSYKGLIVMEQGKPIKTYNNTNGLPDNQVRVTLEDRQGRIWIGTRAGGLLKWENGQFTVFNNKNGLSSNFVMSLCESTDGSIVVGTNDGGINVLQADGGISIYRKEDGLPSTTIFNVRADTGNMVWIASSEGLALLQVETHKLQTFAKAQGLYSNLIFDAVPDSLGNLWFPTPKGVFCMKTADLLSIAQGKLKTADYQLYGSDDGILEPECTGAAQSLFANDGRLFFPTLGGLSVYNPHAKRTSHLSPVLHLEMLMADGQPIDLHAPTISIPHNTERLSIQYTAVNLTSPHEMRFRYKLDKGEWVEAGQERVAIYTNISPGKHVFYVQVRSKNNLWEMQELSLNFYREAYFYETIWFYIASFLAICGALIGAVRFFYLMKLKRIAELNLRLENQVTERTLQLGEANEELKQTNEELNTTLEIVEVERQKSDALLRNILPSETAQELKEKGSATPRSYAQVSVLFTDLKGFTRLAESLSPEAIIYELNHCFSAFDRICEAHGLEKIKTMGDGYMAAAGLPEPNTTNAFDAVQAALEMQVFMKTWQEERKAAGLPAWHLRVGIHTGSVVAGVVGTHKFAYDIWGDSVNIAARMEQSGEPDHVNISADTYALVKDTFVCTARGKIAAKNKGEIEMYFVEKAKQ